ncbi:TlpA disulfide reductase family protein [Curvibacter sp. APW13]|uniref:TlpA family protein disulfide reductase n=1 Tax=Curvibacter sp. APW13 TaxID=3077236 RepID=UPI0028DF3EC9|nr:TlpA disulfide reductase family protein [Curvibacter sp. APW13]MDT8989777.1 TlpA disulfide reductase family protein [Curvibacter sp. APW13]
MIDEKTPSPRTTRRLVLGAAGATLAGIIAGVWWSRRGQVATEETQSTPELEAFWATSWADPQGNPLAVQAFRGKPLLINFWATWCPPCVEELPMLDAFFVENRAKGWQVIGLAVDRVEMVQRFLRQNPVQFPVAMAGLGGSELARALGNLSGGLPFSVVVNGAGAVAQRKLGRVSAENLREWAALK